MTRACCPSRRALRWWRFRLAWRPVVVLLVIWDRREVFGEGGFWRGELTQPPCSSVLVVDVSDFSPQPPLPCSSVVVVSGAVVG